MTPETPKCANLCPPEWADHWREWHRGHGCELDPAVPDDPLRGWVPEFTVWIVRRGSRHPMVVDSVFVHEESARQRAALLGLGEGWKAEKYQHLMPLPDPPEVSHEP